MEKKNEMRDNRPIAEDLEKTEDFDKAKEYEFDDEIYLFKLALEELNGEIDNELNDKR